MPCITEEPKIKWVNQVEMMLEQALRMLTNNQIKSIKGFDACGWQDAESWYREHLLSDFLKNYENEDSRKFYENEAKRLGWKLTKIDGGAKID